MAEIVLRSALLDGGLSDLVTVDSTGVSNEEHGNPVDRRARRVLLSRGYLPGDGHRARRITGRELAEQDLVLPMTSGHANALFRLAHSSNIHTDTIRMFRSFAPSCPDALPGTADRRLDLADPWYGGMDDFEECLDQIEAATPGVVEFIRQQIGQ
jgi:protein-tyrosine phosphatase